MHQTIACSSTRRLTGGPPGGSLDRGSTPERPSRSGGAARSPAPAPRLGRLLIAALALAATAGLVKPAGATQGTGTWTITSPPQIVGSNPAKGGPPCWLYTSQAGGGYLVE